MTNWIMNNILLTVAGGSFLFFILGRFISDEKLERWGFALGQLITCSGNRYLKGAYEKIEGEIVAWGFVFLTGLRKGLKSDNPNGGNGNGKK